MNHPPQEEWISYLYDEADSGTHSRLKAHLAGCESCRVQLEEWQRVRDRLNSWKLDVPIAMPPANRAFRLLGRWAAAALVMIALGFALGRSAGPSSQDVATLRDALRGELAQIVESQIGAANEQTRAALDEFVDYYEARRANDKQVIANALSRLDEARTADYLSLRRDLETVALNSDVELRQTRQQLVRLADYSQSTFPTTPR
jgi:hypothetical protein